MAHTSERTNCWSSRFWSKSCHKSQEADSTVCPWLSTSSRSVSRNATHKLVKCSSNLNFFLNLFHYSHFHSFMISLHLSSITARQHKTTIICYKQLVSRLQLKESAPGMLWIMHRKTVWARDYGKYWSGSRPPQQLQCVYQLTRWRIERERVIRSEKLPMSTSYMVLHQPWVFTLDKTWPRLSFSTSQAFLYTIGRLAVLQFSSLWNHTNVKIMLTGLQVILQRFFLCI